MTTLKNGWTSSNALQSEIIDHLRREACWCLFLHQAQFPHLARKGEGGLLRTRFLDIKAFTSIARGENEHRIIARRIRVPMFEEDKSRLFNRAQPRHTRGKKGVVSLARSEKAPVYRPGEKSSVVDFTKEATAIELVVQQRYRQHDLCYSAANTCALLAGNKSLEVIQEVVPDKFGNLNLLLRLRNRFQHYHL